MPPWHIDRSIGEYVADPSLSRHRDRDHRGWVDARRTRGAARGRAAGQVFAATSEWTYGQPDMIVHMKKGFTIPGRRSRLHSGGSRRSEAHRGSLRQVGADHSAGVPAAVHHAHVYVDLPDGVDTDGLGVGMGSNIGDCDRPDRVRSGQRRGHLPRRQRRKS